MSKPLKFSNFQPLNSQRITQLVRDPFSDRMRASPDSGLAHNDLNELCRLHSYQAAIDRASALLCRLQPDLIAAEVLPQHEIDPARVRWPFILAVGLSTSFWMGIGWAVSMAVLQTG